MDSIETDDLFGSGFSDSMQEAGDKLTQARNRLRQDGERRTIEVWGVQDELMAEMCGYYFENPADGGGHIQESHWDKREKVLSITFADAAVAQRLDAELHDVGGHLLAVTLKEMSSTVKVTGVDPERKALYTLYFKSPTRGGGPIVDIKVDDQLPAIFITFENPEVAKAVCSRSHKVGGRQLQVTLHVPQRGQRESEEAPTRTVVVTGDGELQTQDSYLYYFENPRNGGGKVEDVTIDNDSRAIYVTFSEPKVAQAVAGRKHSVGGQPVLVRPYVPRKPKPAYPDKLLFQNVAPSTSKECLAMYLECISGMEPEDIFYGDEPGVVLVTFPEKPDVCKVQDKCRERKLMGRQLTVSSVPVSNCLLVERLAPTTSEDTLMMYFDNSRRSGGGPVERVEIKRDKDTCTAFVYFEVDQVLEEVLQKTHKLDGRTLHVKRYMECLGTSGGSRDPTSFPPPNPIILKDVDTFKIAFLCQSRAAQKDFTQMLAVVYAFPKFTDNTVTIECSLTKAVPHARTLAGTWTEDAQRMTKGYFRLIDVQRIDVDQQLWQEVSKCVLSVPIPNRQEAVTFSLGEEKALMVVGRSEPAGRLFRQINEQIEERRNQEITETNDKLKRHQLRLLVAMAFHVEACKHHPSLHVDINTKKCEIIFRGKIHEVKEAQVEMYEHLNRVKMERITDLSDMQKAFLDKKETRQTVVQKFRAEQTIAVFEVGTAVTVFAFSDDSAVKAVHLIRKTVISHVCQLTQESAQLLTSPDWQNLVKTLLESGPRKLLITPSHDGRQVHVTGTDDIVHGVVTDVENFMEEHTIYTEVVRYSPCRHRFITVYWQHRLYQIMVALKEYQVGIILREKEEMHISGTRTGLEQLKVRLRQLEEEVVVHTETLSDRAAVTFLTSGRCDKDLDMLGRSCQCIVSLELELEPPGLQVVKPSSGSSTRHPAADGVLDKRSTPRTDEAKLHIYAGGKNSVQEVLRSFRDLVRDRFTRKTLLDETLRTMTPQEMDQIYQAGRKHNVEVKVSAALGSLTLDGIHNNVFESIQEIFCFIRNAQARKMTK